MTFFFNKKVILTLLLIASMAIAGFATVNFINSSQLSSAQASSQDSSDSQSNQSLSEEEQIRKRVKDNPDAGLEAIDEDTLEQSKFFIKTLPRFITEKEIKSQLEDGYITQKQHDEFMKLIDEKEGK